jgi:hypothetical protein
MANALKAKLCRRNCRRFDASAIIVPSIQLYVKRGWKDQQFTRNQHGPSLSERWISGSLELPPPFHGAHHGDFVGVFDV